MKKTIILIFTFIIFTTLIKLCPVITLWDKSVIAFIQKALTKLPLFIPILPDCMLYSVMIAVPIIVGSLFFLKKRKWINVAFICSVPLVTFLLNSIIKPLVHRSRPPYELQQVIHPESFSYVSSHSLVTLVLYGMVIYYFHKYCPNKTLKNIVISISVLWILFVGLSRVWLGVHYPTDVFGAYLLGFILLTIYCRIRTS